MGSAESTRISNISRVIIILRKRLSPFFWRSCNLDFHGLD